MFKVEAPLKMPHLGRSFILALGWKSGGVCVRDAGNPVWNTTMDLRMMAFMVSEF